MEHVIVQALIQQGAGHTGSYLCTLWQWGYWAAFVVGVIGTAVAFFMQPPR